MVSSFVLNNKLNTRFINAIDKYKYADLLDNISVLFLGQILPGRHTWKKAEKISSE